MKYWLITIACASILLTQVLSQTLEPPPPAPELSELLSRFSPPPVKSDCQPPARVDPLVIKKWIEENPECNRKPIWRLLNTEGDSFDNTPNEVCQVKLQDVYLSTEKARMKMLQIILVDEAHYLFFSHPETDAAPQSEWRFVGIISSEGQQYGPPSLRFEGYGHYKWAVVNELCGRGSGVSLHGESWYEINSSGIRKALSYPISGNDFTFVNVTNRSFQAIPVLIESDKNAMVLITFVVNYEDLLKAGIPLSKAQKAFYVRDETSGEFKLDESHSEITADEVEAVYNFDSLDEAAFIKYNRAALRKIIAHAKPEQKTEWRKYLQESGPKGYRVLEELLR